MAHKQVAVNRGKPSLLISITDFAFSNIWSLVYHSSNRDNYYYYYCKCWCHGKWTEVLQLLHMVECFLNFFLCQVTDLYLLMAFILQRNSINRMNKFITKLKDKAVKWMKWTPLNSQSRLYQLTGNCILMENNKLLSTETSLERPVLH